MQCPRCGHESPAGARFCGECGGALGPTCPACRTLNAPGNSYCSDCRAAFGTAAGPESTPDPHAYTPRHLAERIIRAREALEGERKQVTVLFADLSGSLEILADRCAEAGGASGMGRYVKRGSTPRRRPRRGRTMCSSWTDPARRWSWTRRRGRATVRATFEALKDVNPVSRSGIGLLGRAAAQAAR